MLIIQQPSGSLELKFAKEWATKTINQGNNLPRYLPNKVLIDDIQAIIRRQERDSDPPEFKEAVRIMKAGFIKRAMKLDFTFKFSICIERGVNSVLEPKNLPTLVFIHGQEQLPKGLEEFGKWKGKKHIYQCTRNGTYRITEL